MASVLFTYTGEAAKTKELIENGIDPIIGKIYKHKNGFYWKINNKGYIHILKPNRVKFNGKTAWYEIVDILLTRDNKLKECGSIEFKNEKECRTYLEGENNGII